MSQATYLIKKRIEDIASPVFAPKALVLQPGRGASTDDEEFGTYSVVTNRDYEIPQIRIDVISIQLFSSQVKKIHDSLELILDDLNHVSMAGHALNNTNIRFNEVVARVIDTSENSVINGEDAYSAHLVVSARYVKRPSQIITPSVPSYLEGV